MPLRVDFAVACEIHTVNGNLIIAVFYHPPESSPYRETEASLLSVFEHIQKRIGPTTHLLILGDFNLPGIDWNSLTSSSNDGDQICAYSFKRAWYQLIAAPTHASGATLDLAFTNSDSISVRDIVTLPFSDHSAIMCEATLRKTTSTIQPSTNLYSVSQAKIPQLKLALATDLSPFQIERSGTFYTIWIDWLISLLNAYVPKKRRKRGMFPNYYSSHTIHQLNILGTLERRASNDQSKLANQRANVSMSIELDIATYTDRFVRNGTGLRDCYRLLNTLSTQNALPNMLQWNENTAIGNQEVANLFNKYFVSVYSESPALTMDPLILRNMQQLDSVSFTLDEICAALASASLGTGPDGIPGLLLSECANELSPHVGQLFQHILETSTYPTEWKESHVIPIFKKGDRSAAASYRPISILSKISLVFERLLFDKIYAFVKDKLNKRQFGFMKRRCTVLQLLDFMKDAYNSTDNAENLYTLYVDFAKAFDKVPHNVLLKKLEKIGINGKLLVLLKSYLTGRWQRVRIDNVLSMWLWITSGVPQGSILGPLLFIIFIDDLPDVVVSSVIRMFADDTKLTNTCLEQLRLDGERVLKWAVENHMKFNMEKTVLLPIPAENASVTFGSIEIESSGETRDLGLVITSELKWDKHLTARLQHLNYLLIRLKRVIPFSTPTHTKLALYKSYFLSSLMYNSQIWLPSHGMLRKLETFQKRATKWILNVDGYVSRLRMLKLLPIAYQHQINDLIFLKKLMTNHFDFNFLEMVSLKETPSYSLRSSTLPLLNVPMTRLRRTDEFFGTRAAILANKMMKRTTITITLPQSELKRKLISYANTSLSDYQPRSCNMFLFCICVKCREQDDWPKNKLAENRLAESRVNWPIFFGQSSIEFFGQFDLVDWPNFRPRGFAESERSERSGGEGAKPRSGRFGFILKPTLETRTMINFHFFHYFFRPIGLSNFRPN
jgi:hypothetical protein